MTLPLSQQTFSGYTLRPDQQELLAQIKHAVAAGKRRIMVQCACSYGKTIVASAITNGALAKGNKVIFTVPGIGLVEQTAQKFFRAGIYHTGIIQADHPGADPTAPVQIASIHTLMRRRKLPEAAVVMPDEGHIWYSFYERWMAMPEWKDVPFIFWSATPWTKGLGKHMDHFIVGATLKQMIEQGLSCDFDPYAPLGKTRPDLSKLDLVIDPRTGEKDYHQGQLSKVMRDPVLVGNCVREWLERGEDKPTMLFAVDRAHAADLQAEFQKHGVKTAYMDKDTPPAERTKIGEQLEQGDVRVLSQVATCIYGIDWPHLECISWNCPSKSEMKLVQGFGRCIRRDPNNPLKRSIFIDHSNTCANLGLPTEIHYSELHDGTKRSAEKRKKEREEREERLPWECPVCARLNDASVAKCPDPSCPYDRRRRSKVEYVEGEIVAMRPSTAKAQITQAQKQLWYSSLLSIEKARCYKDGWSANQYKRRFKEWPNGLVHVQTEPTPEVLNYVKAGQIRWAHSRQNPSRAAA